MTDEKDSGVYWFENFTNEAARAKNYSATEWHDIGCRLWAQKCHTSAQAAFAASAATAAIRGFAVKFEVAGKAVTIDTFCRRHEAAKFAKEHFEVNPECANPPFKVFVEDRTNGEVLETFTTEGEGE